MKYFTERRTTSHWPYSLHVNGLQPHTFGNNNLLVDYSKITPPQLDDFTDKIKLLF